MQGKVVYGAGLECNGNPALMLLVELFAKARCGMNPMMRKFIGG